MTRDEGYRPLEDDGYETFEALGTEHARQPTEQFEVDEGIPDLPRWRREQHINPKPCNVFQRFADWIAGSHLPQIQTIKPWFPHWQEMPLRLVDGLANGKRINKIAILLIFLISYIGVWVPLLFKHWEPGTIDHKYLLRRLDCTDSFWLARNECGIGGINCRPLDDDRLAFRCPPGCASEQVLNPRAVGAEEVIYQPLVIGGPTYRGDSFICGSAMHSGLVSDSGGGCGVVARVGTHSNFPSSTKNGITSIGFNSSFPLSIEFESAGRCETSELRWELLGISVTFTAILSLCTTSASLFFFTVLPAIFFQIGLISNPPSQKLLNELFSGIVGRLLPSACCMFVIYQYCVKLHDLRAQVEKTLFWLGPYWVGALSNLTIERWLPIQRLTPHDIRQQPGAKAALAVIVALVFGIVCQQIYYFRRERRLLRYLLLYGIFILFLTFLSSIPDLQLRIHHYILALLLLPGTSMQTRFSLVYQGLLLGLFVNETARWGFDSIVQSSEALREDGKLGSMVPDAVAPLIATAHNLTLALGSIPVSDVARVGTALRGIMGISVLVNDVERFRQHGDVEMQPNFTWHRDEQEPQYFRFAYVAEEVTLDYTSASIWHPNGTWTRSNGTND